MAQVRLDDDLVADVDAVAAVEGWSRTAAVNRLVAEALDARDAPAAATAPTVDDPPPPVARPGRASVSSPVSSRRRLQWVR